MTAFAMGAIAASTAKSIPIFNFIPVFYIGLRRTPDGFIRDSGIDLFAINLEHDSPMKIASSPPMNAVGAPCL